jgi:asparagine synthase (glutamine-hydrolysing)
LLEQTEPVEVTSGEAERHVREILLNSARCHLIADVPVGLFLSSGVDSVSVARLAKDAGARDVQTITALFSDFAGGANDETAQATAIAHALSFKHQNLKIQLDRSALLAELDDLIDAMDQPSVDGINTYFISQAAKRNGMKVALSGLGGDEIFGGYPLFKQIPSYLDRFSRLSYFPGATRLLDGLFTSKMARRFFKPRHQGLFRSGTNEASAYLLLRSVYHPWELPEVLDPDLALQGLEDLNISDRLTRIVGQIGTAHGKVMALEMSMYMRNQLLVTSDWAGMAHSLEIRVPLVDVEVFKGLASLVLSSHPPSKATLGASAQLNTLLPIRGGAKVGFDVPISQFMLLSSGMMPVGKANEYRAWAQFIRERVEKVA